MTGRRRMARLFTYLGAIVVVAGMSKIHAAYVANPPYDFTGSFRFAWAIAYVGLLTVAAYGLGLPELPRTIKASLVAAVGAAGVAAVGMSLVQLVVGDELLPRFVVAGSALLLVPWWVFCCGISTAGRGVQSQRDRLVVVADPNDAHMIREDLRLEPERSVALVHALSPEEADSTAAISGATDVSRLPLVAAAQERSATVVVLSREAHANESVVAQAAALHSSGVRVRTVSLFYEEWLGKLPLTELERTSLMFDIGEVHRQRYTRAKRVVDLGVGLVGFVLFALTIPFIAVLDLAFNRGPVFYRQPRVGKNGVLFSILKFRTMRAVDGDAAGGQWTADDDPRITPFGRVLRTTHVDELPQMWNILKGDLSVVGPRPEQPQYVEELVKKLPFYDMRHLIRPGLTGWAQVKYGYAGNEADAVEKLQYEFFYLRRQSLGLDLRIMGRTLRSVLGRQGR